MIHKWLVLLFLLHVSLNAQNFTTEEKLYLQEKKEITLCVDPDWMPVEKIEKGIHIGINADYIQHLSTLIQTPITLIPTKDWLQSIEFMRSRTCDILSLSADTPSRREYLNFTQPTFDYSLSIATTIDKAFVETIDSVSHLKLAIVKGYAFIELLKEKYPHISFVEVNNLQEGFSLVKKEEVFGYIDLLSVLSYAIQNNAFESLKINGRFDNKWLYHIGVRNDEPLLLNVLNKAIKNTSAQTKAEIQNRWISVQYENKSTYKVVMQILFISFFPICLFFYRFWIIARYNKKLHSALKSFEALVESTIEGIIIFNENMYCIMANQAASDIFGYTKEELIGKHYTTFIAKNAMHEVKKSLESSNLPPHEVLCVKKDGTRFTVLTRGVDAIWNEQKVRISSVIDITEYKELHNNLEALVASHVQDIEQKKELIQQQSKLISMGEMIGAIAHQWRQPLNALNINIQNLEDDYKENLIDEQFVEEFIERNCKTIQYMSDTIDDFRNFFRIDKEKQDFFVLEAIKETLNLQGALLANHSIKVLMSGKDVMINSFKSEFKQVILNLINNAKDAIVDNQIKKGKINIHIANGVITIEDNAGGIHQTIIDRVFEPYFTTKEQGKGIGLGLYISKMIIEQNIKGFLKVENGKLGAKFSITLPSYKKQTTSPNNNKNANT